jgi:hypothetical protein
LSIVHDNAALPVFATEESVTTVSNQPTATTTNPPAATADVVVNAIVVDDGSAPFLPRSPTSSAIAIYGSLSGAPVS